MTTLKKTYPRKPSHPTVRAVFPPPAVRPSACPGLHRRALVPDHPAANIHEASGIPGTMRRVLPSEPTALTAPGQGASKADSDAALQGPQGLAGIGVAIGVDPPPAPRDSPAAQSPAAHSGRAVW